MKRALLFICASFAGLSSFAQTDTLFANFKNSQIDTIASLIPLTFPSSAHGSISGVNDQGRTKFAQLYRTFKQVNSNFYGWQITGSISNWIGHVASTSNGITVRVWSVDSSDAVKNDVNGRDSVTGFPGTVLGSQSMSFSSSSFHANANPPVYNAFPTHTVVTFPTAINVNRPFFLGYEFSAGYTWGTSGMAGDTISLATTLQPTGGGISAYDNMRQRYYAHVTPATPGPNDTCFLSVTAYYDGLISNAWQDYNWKDGIRIYLDIVPIVTPWDDNVQGLTRNNLTFFGSYPNPAVNTANIKFSLEHGSNVSIEIMDMSGRTINSIDQNNVSAGEHIIPVSTANLASGTYLYILKAGADAFASQLTVVK